MIGIKRQNVGARLLERSEVLGLLAGDVGLIDTPVLVAALILPVENVLRIGLPNEIADAALAIVGDDAVVGLAQRAHPDVQHALIGGEVSQHRSVRRNLRAGAFGIAEKNAARN